MTDCDSAAMGLEQASLVNRMVTFGIIGPTAVAL